MHSDDAEAFSFPLHIALAYSVLRTRRMCVVLLLGQGLRLLKQRPLSPDVLVIENHHGDLFV